MNESIFNTGQEILGDFDLIKVIKELPMLAGDDVSLEDRMVALRLLSNLSAAELPYAPESLRPVFVNTLRSLLAKDIMNGAESMWYKRSAVGLIGFLRKVLSEEEVQEVISEAVSTNVRRVIDLSERYHKDYCDVYGALAPLLLNPTFKKYAISSLRELGLRESLYAELMRIKRGYNSHTGEFANYLHKLNTSPDLLIPMIRLYGLVEDRPNMIYDFEIEYEFMSSRISQDLPALAKEIQISMRRMLVNSEGVESLLQEQPSLVFSSSVLPQAA